MDDSDSVVEEMQPLDNGPGEGVEGTGGGQPDMSVDPLQWWKLNQASFPILARVARKYLAIPASSAAAERMFSYTGMRVGKCNAKLDDETLLSLMLIRSLTKFVQRWGPKYLSSE